MDGYSGWRFRCSRPYLLEADDLVGAYGHHYIGAATPVVARPAEVRSDLEIVQGLAERVGLGSEMGGSQRRWKERVVADHLAAHRVTVQTLEAGAVRNPLSPRIVFEGRRFSTPSGRVQLLDGLPEMGAPVDPDYPLLLTAVSTERAQSSQWAKPAEDPARVTVHPEAAAGIPHDGLARLASRVGEMAVRVCHDARQRRDVALMAKGGHHRSGHCANALIRARTTDGGEGGALYDEPVCLLPP
jgi:anaerobic selenocysteine-containing dehydrogenase